MLATTEDRYQAAIEDAAATAFEARIGQAAMDALHRYGDHIVVGYRGHSMIRAFEAMCEDAAAQILGPAATTESELLP